MKRNVYTLCLLIILLLTGGCKKNGITPENKKMGDSHYKMALAEFSEKNMTRALQELLKGYRYDPTNYELCHLLGLAYLSKKEYSQSVKHLLEAITLKKGKFPQARNNLGIVYLEMGQYDDAIVQFKAASDNLLYETPEFAYTNLGWAYYKKGEFVKAKEYYKKSINLEPRHSLAYFNLARMYFDLEKYDDSVAEYKEAIRYYPNYLDAWQNLATTYFKMGKKKEAEEAFNKVIEIAPGTKRAEEAQGYLDLLK